QKAGVVEAIESFALKVGCHPQVAQAVATATDELVTNAVYNAPTDDKGRPKFSHYSRSIEVNLASHEEVGLQFGFDGRRLGISARDPFGSLTPNRVLDYLTKCFARGEDQMDQKEGGAGLGLYFVFNAVHNFIVNIDPGRAT